MTEDTTETSGIGLVVTNKRFPKMTRPIELDTSSDVYESKSRNQRIARYSRP
jgi:hypothetical protein